MDSQQKKRPLLAIIDGKSIFYRGYYAMPNLSTKDGMPTGGVYGFMSLSIELIRRLKPDYVIVAWDKPKTNIRKRKAIYPEYKAGRKPAPADFYEQIPILHELLDGFGWPLYELDDYEADDILGTLAVQANAQDIEVALITSDLDALQVVGPLTKVYALKKGLSNIDEFDISAFEKKYGIVVEQFLDYKSLKGDSSDNLPGVPGVGDKTATSLLQEFGTLDNIYENLDKIKPTIRTKLANGKESAYITKQVAEMWLDAPVELDLEAADVSKYDGKKLKELLIQLEFIGLLNRLKEQLVDIDDDSSTSLKPNKPDFKVFTPSDKVDIFAKWSKSRVYLWLNEVNLTLSDGLNLVRFELDETSLGNRQRIQQYLDAGEEIVGYDIKNAMHSLARYDLRLSAQLYDVRLAAFILNPLIRDKSLGALAGDYIDETNLEQVIATLMGLHSQQNGELDKIPRLKKLVYKIEFPMIKLLYKMESLGVKLDIHELGSLEQKFTGDISKIEQSIFEYARREFNINSPQQLSQVLFQEMELPTDGIKKSKTAYSTGAKELAKLRLVHPIIDEISHYRELSKLLSTYVVALPKLVDETSRLHTTFSQDVVPTGRLSSANPNLQNIPIRSDSGMLIRGAFVAGEGNVFISADYSQFELRLAAIITGEEAMIQAFADDVDIHLQTAAQIHGISTDDVTKQQRSEAKAVNFGIMYGLGAHALSESTGMSFAEAKQFIVRYFEIRPKLKAYLDDVRTNGANRGFVETILGRRRPTPDMKSSNHMVREAAYRASINMPIQGSAADIMKLAMLKLEKTLPEGANQIIQIHDSVIVECRDDQAEQVAKILVDTMENIYPKLSVRLKADVKVGRTWTDL